MIPAGAGKRHAKMSGGVAEAPSLSQSDPGSRWLCRWSVGGGSPRHEVPVTRLTQQRGRPAEPLVEAGWGGTMSACRGKRAVRVRKTHRGRTRKSRIMRRQSASAMGGSLPVCFQAESSIS